MSQIENPSFKRMAVCVFLAVATLLVFGRTVRYDYVNYDDNLYVYANPVVEKGFTFHGIEWAFTHTVSSNWHPLTLISLMFDREVFGPRPFGQHLTNVLLHAAAAVLLFLALQEMTGALWRSAFVAAIFAVHPLRVESVAWISERKDVLSAVFFMLTLWAYAWYVRRASSRSRYFLVAFCFALGLMSKPSLVPLPFLLLLLDYWPLNRSGAGPVRLVVEKVPIFILSALSCAATLFAQRGSIMPIAGMSFPLRLQNAAISGVMYIWKMIWPAGLSVLYPIPRSYPLWEVALAILLLAGITAGVFMRRKTEPWLLVGWLWYLLMLAPVIGLIQVGLQALADRYTYLSEIGLALAVTWWIADRYALLTLTWPASRRHLVSCFAAAAVIAAAMLGGFEQSAYWKNSETLWTRTLACTSRNPIAHFKLGIFFLREGLPDEALPHLQEAVQIDPKFSEANNNLGVILAAKHDLDGAIDHFQKAVDAQPSYAEAHNNLGRSLFDKGKVTEAISEYRASLDLVPEDGPCLGNLAIALAQDGQKEEAIEDFQRALRLEPNSGLFHEKLADVLAQSDRMEEAIYQYHAALEINPSSVTVLNNLAWIFATDPTLLRNGKAAIELASKANVLTGGKQPVILDTLAAAYAEAGRFPEAVRSAKAGIDLALAQHNEELANRIRKRLSLYESHSLGGDSDTVSPQNR